ncbi:MAG: pyridoxal-phosphate dependent enzyme [bacterium]
MQSESPTAKLTLSCVRCGRTFPWSFTVRCPSCQAMIDVDYDLSRARIATDGPPMQRYFDILPLMSRDFIIDGGEGGTPCRHAKELGRALDLAQLYLKIEGANPTRTTKDRQATQVVATFRELGINHFVTSSTGNSCTALAHIVARFPEMRMSVFVGDEFNERLHWKRAPNVTVYWLPQGTFVDAHAAALWFATREGLASERGFFSFAKREPLKMAYLEAVDQVPRPISCYVQGISSAMGVHASWKGALQFQALGKIRDIPRFVGVQEETCDPMARAWRRGSGTMTEADVVARPRGLSKATLRGDSRQVYTYIHDIMRSTGGTILTASQDAMRAMRTRALETEGLDICYTSSMTLVAAAALRREGWLGRDDVVLLNLTGADRTGMPHVQHDYLVHKGEAPGEEWRIEAAADGARAESPAGERSAT